MNGAGPRAMERELPGDAPQSIQAGSEMTRRKNRRGNHFSA